MLPMVLGTFKRLLVPGKYLHEQRVLPSSRMWTIGYVQRCRKFGFGTNLIGGRDVGFLAFPLLRCALTDPVPERSGTKFGDTQDGL